MSSSLRSAIASATGTVASDVTEQPSSNAGGVTNTTAVEAVPSARTFGRTLNDVNFRLGKLLSATAAGELGIPGGTLLVDEVPLAHVGTPLTVTIMAVTDCLLEDADWGKKSRRAYTPEQFAEYKFQTGSKLKPFFAETRFDADLFVLMPEQETNSAWYPYSIGENKYAAIHYKEWSPDQRNDFGAILDGFALAGNEFCVGKTFHMELVQREGKKVPKFSWKIVSGLDEVQTPPAMLEFLEKHGVVQAQTLAKAA